jgi:hypothetical protein
MQTNIHITHYTQWSGFASVLTILLQFMFKHSAVSGLGCQKYGPSLRFVTLCASVITHTKTFIVVRGVMKMLVFEKHFNHLFRKK